MNELSCIDFGDDYSQKKFCNSGGLFGGGGGSQGSGSDAHVTTTQTNPVVPDDMKALADSLNGISTGLLGAPVNFGRIPGLDAPRSGPLIPRASMGQMFSNPAFQMGMNRMNPSGQGSMPQPRPQMRMPLRRPQLPPRPMGQQPPSTGSMFAGQY